MPQNNILKTGWGIATGIYNGRESLFATDGSSKISVIDPINWTHIKTITVRDQNGQEVRNLNELEIILTNMTTVQYMFANQWLSNLIHLIDLKTGIIVKTWDFKELNDIITENLENKGEVIDNDAVLNGIAYLESKDAFIITGKLWDQAFLVKLDYYKYMD